MPSAFVGTIDRAAEQKMLKGYRPEAVTAILQQAAKEGGRAAKAVLAPRAPIGTSSRLSQYYRRLALAHGTFRRSVRAAMIRGRGSALGKGLQGRTVGYVIGPIGKNAFTRGWIELGTRHQKARPWVEEAAGQALTAAYAASDAVLTLYAEKT